MEKGQIIVTGATGSIGRESVRALVRKGFPVIMVCRDVERGESFKSVVQEACPTACLEVAQVDMSSLKSVAAFVEQMKGRNVRLDGLFNNAGTMERNYALSEDGFEKTVAVNYLAPYFLTRSLLPLLQPQARVVNMVSLTCRTAKLDRAFFEKTEKDFSQLGTYGNSKLALWLFTMKLAETTGFYVNASDPGIVNSNMISLDRWFDPLADAIFRPFCKSPAKGALPAVNALTSECTGCFFVGGRCKETPRKIMLNPQKDWLWEKTEEVLRQKGFCL